MAYLAPQLLPGSQRPPEPSGPPPPPRPSRKPAGPSRKPQEASVLAPTAKCPSPAAPAPANGNATLATTPVNAAPGRAPKVIPPRVPPPQPTSDADQGQSNDWSQSNDGSQGDQSKDWSKDDQSKDWGLQGNSWPDWQSSDWSQGNGGWDRKSASYWKSTSDWKPTSQSDAQEDSGGGSSTTHGYEVVFVSEREAKLMLTMEGFIHAHLSRVIGKRGSNLTQMKKDTGATVHLCGKDSNRPTDEPNHLLIRGSPKVVKDAVQRASDLVAGVLDLDFPWCQTCGKAHKNRDCPKLVQTFGYECNIPLEPGTKVGFIIGSGGRNVAPIKEETGALIRVMGIGSGQLHATDPLHIRVACTSQEKLDKAVAGVKDLIKGVVTYSPYGNDKPPEGHVFAHRHVYPLDAASDSCDALIAHIFGKAGQNLRRIREFTGAWLWIRGKGSGLEESFPESASEPLHLLMEHDDEFYLEEAVKLVDELLQSVGNHMKDTYCRNCGGPHFTYRCEKANSMGYKRELASKGRGKGASEDKVAEPDNVAEPVDEDGDGEPASKRHCPSE